MRDNLMGGLLAFGVAAPVVIVCCGGGIALFATALSGLAAWMSGLGWITLALVVALALLVVRGFRRFAKHRASISNYSSEQKIAP